MSSAQRGCWTARQVCVRAPPCIGAAVRRVLRDRGKSAKGYRLAGFSRLKAAKSIERVSRERKMPVRQIFSAANSAAEVCLCLPQSTAAYWRDCWAKAFLFGLPDPPKPALAFGARLRRAGRLERARSATRGLAGGANRPSP